MAPHQPRLDWQMWFAALTPYRANPEQWFARLLGRVLAGEPTVLALFATNPFANAPPRFVPAVVWEYHFSAPDDDSGAWWRREWRGIYAPVIERRASVGGERSIAPSRQRAESAAPAPAAQPDVTTR